MKTLHNFKVLGTCCMMLFAGVASEAQNIFPSSGNVGIGTTTPAYPLHIKTGYMGIQIDGNSSSWTGMYINNTTSTGQPFYGYQIPGKSAWHYLKPNGDWSLYNNGDRLTVNYANGNLGVGTTSPTSRLHVVGGGTYSVDLAVNGRIQTGDAGNGGGVWLNSAQTQFVGQIDANRVGFWNNGAFRMSVDNAGNVGIGTSTPSYNLHIASPNVRAFQIDGSASTWTGMYINATSATGLPFYGYITNGNYAWTYLDPSGSWKLYNGGDRMTVLNNGNVLINKTSQSNSIYKLDVNGSSRFNEVVVNTTGADFVFEDKYRLRPLNEVESYIKENKHLPEVPSAKEMQEEGMKLAEVSTTLLQKVEELTLYMIELKKENEALKARIESMEKNK